MQERITQKLQKQMHGGLAGGVSRWLDFALEDAPPLDAHMNVAEIESIVSARESQAAGTPVPGEETAEPEAIEAEEHNESTKRINEMKKLIENEAVEVPDNQMEKRDAQSSTEQL